MAFIYKTTNLLNGKIYIGQSVKNDNDYYGSGVILKKSILKYGKENFKKEILEECDPINLNDREIYWIKFYESVNNGYNVSKGGQKGWMSGLKHSKDTIEKMKLSNSGIKNGFYNKKHTDETKKKISESLRNSDKFQKSMKSEERIEKLRISALKRVQSDETKKKISDKNKGKKWSNEMKNKMSEIQKEIKPFYGKHHSDESKLKISNTHKGKIVNEDTKNKMRINNTGKKLSNNTKLKIGKSLEKEIYKVIDNVVIQHWKSSKDATNDMNLSVKKIRYYCSKKNINNKYNLIYKKDYDNKEE